GGASYILSTAKWLASLIFDSADETIDLLGQLVLHWAGRLVGMTRFDSRKRQSNAAGGRSVRREVKLTVDQNLALQVMADEAGVSVARLLVESTLSQSRGETAAERHELITLLFLLQRGLAAAGNNINQIARVANTTGEIKDDLHDSLEHLRATVARIDEVLESLKIAGDPA
ncbi:MobC family plasmid mobilization relaxosome protein, partial [Glutamicibacter sp. NPDC087673]|uniref:MobC family plasmid mobilization relaxosome protein n=1 Tax=Glutamicibacter sp. NPDC087673 TaxID=3363997 RepID=UPI003816C66C